MHWKNLNTHFNRQRYGANDTSFIMASTGARVDTHTHTHRETETYTHTYTHTQGDREGRREEESFVVLLPCLCMRVRY